MGQKTLQTLYCKMKFFFYTKPLQSSHSFVTIDMCLVYYSNFYREAQMRLKWKQ